MVDSASRAQVASRLQTELRLASEEGEDPAGAITARASRYAEAPLAEAHPDHGPTEDDVAATLRADLVEHIHSLALPTGATQDKAQIRTSHAQHRLDVWRREYRLVASKLDDLLGDFAHGHELAPSTIVPTLSLVTAGTRDADLFRAATLLWSVPVSNGYGRRMRFLVRDASNGRLIGLFALGDPVFNLRARDEWLGWDPEARRLRLVNVMDAFVVGAVPPYAGLLGGKLVASLIGSAEVSEAFEARYGSAVSVRGARKNPRLVLATVTSSLGRSSIYNRLRLGTRDADGHALVELIRIGATEGYGHFQLSNDLFKRVRAFLESRGHPYANGNRYGMGPNWKMRVLRVGLQELGLARTLQNHGIGREVFAMPRARNFREYLLGETREAEMDSATAAELGAAAVARWVIPRSLRQPTYVDFDPLELGVHIREEAKAMGLK